MQVANRVTLEKNQSLLKLVIYYLLYVGIIFAIYAKINATAETIFDPINNAQNSKESLLCMSPDEINAGLISSVPHLGAVTIPVGSTIVGLKRWSSAATWVGGIKPIAGDDVEIPANSVVVLDENVNVKSITVKGKLIVDLTKNISVTSEYLMVMGVGSYFEWGTETENYTNIGVLTLFGNDVNAVLPGTTVSSKCLMAMSGGRVEMHGKDKSRWTQLNGIALVGATSIIVDNTTNWSVGDELMITSTAIETEFTGRKPTYSETEKVIISSIVGKTITFTTPLKFKHYGKLQTFTNGVGTSWIMDERAEVGNLSRSIKIIGSKIISAIESENRFGGHVMIMGAGSIGHLSSVEFSNMGQAGLIGRYSFHWHQVGNATGQYIRDCAIKDANNRAITVHGTQNVSVAHNTIHNIRGHAIFLEDGDETGVVINRNLIAEVLKPTAGLHLLASDRFFQQNRIEGPSGIWLMNPQNTVLNNAIVGTGTGIWYSLDDVPHGMAASKTTIKPNQLPFGNFSGNRAHGCYIGFNVDFVDIDNDPVKTVCNQQNYFPSNFTFEDFTGFSNYRAVWFRGSTQNFNNFKMANNEGLGQWVPTFLGVLKNSLVVGHSDNNNGTINFETYGTSIYDGNLAIENSHFENFDQPNQAIFTTFGGAHKHLPAEARIGITMKNCNVYMSPKNETEFSPYISFVEDQTGALTGTAGNYVTPDHPFMIDPSFISLPGGTGGYHINKRFARLGVEFAGRNRTQGKQLIYMDWEDGHMAHNSPAGSFCEFPLMVNSSRIHRMRFTEFVPASTTMWYEWGDNGDWVEFFLEGIPQKLIPENNTPDHLLTEVVTLPAMKASTVSTYYYDATTNYMHFRLKYNSAKRKFILNTPNGLKAVPTNKQSTAHEFRPYGNFHTLNEQVEAEYFDHGGQNVAYNETIDWSLSAAGGYLLNNRHFSTLNHLTIRKGEIVDLQTVGSGNYYIVDTDINDFWNYSFDIKKPGTYPIVARIATTAGVEISVLIDGVQQISNLTSTAGVITNVALGNVNFNTAKKYHITIKVKKAGLTKFDWFKIMDPNPLPVSLLEFNVWPETNTTKLFWLTGEEKENDYFSIERSVNGINFNVIAEVKGKNTNQSSYSFTDEEPLNGLSYYRFIQVDFNKKENPGPIKSVNRSTDFSLSNWPNPFNQSLSIKSNTVEPLEIFVTDVNGRLITSTYLNGGTVLQLGQEFPSGIYFIHYYLNGQSMVSKIIKN